MLVSRATVSTSVLTSLAELLIVGRVDVLNGLAVRLEHIDANDTVVELLVGRLHNLVVEMLFVLEPIEALENKVEQRLQVLGIGGSDEDVRVAGLPLISNCLHIQDAVYYPNATAAAIARPKAADLPRPREAVSATVLRRDFSEIAS